MVGILPQQRHKGLTRTTAEEQPRRRIARLAQRDRHRTYLCHGDAMAHSGCL